jgi:hypothetical protein
MARPETASTLGTLNVSESVGLLFPYAKNHSALERNLDGTLQKMDTLAKQVWYSARPRIMDGVAKARSVLRRLLIQRGVNGFYPRAEVLAT